MRLLPNLHPARWVVALAFVGMFAAVAPDVRAENDEPYPTPVEQFASTFGVFMYGAGMGMTAIW